MYKSASKFLMSVHKPERKSHPKDEFVWAILSRLVEMTAYQLLVTEIKRRSSELHAIDHPIAISTIQILDFISSLESVYMPSKHDMQRMSRSSLDNILLQSYPEYARYCRECSKVIFACNKLQEHLNMNIGLSSVQRVIIKRLDAKSLLKELLESTVVETKNKWPLWVHR